MSTVQRLEACLSSLQGHEALGSCEELSGVINQGTVLLAMARDVDAGNVSPSTPMGKFDESVNEYIAAVEVYISETQQ